MCSCFMLEQTVKCHSLTILSLPLFLSSALYLEQLFLRTTARRALRKRLAPARQESLPEHRWGQSVVVVRKTATCVLHE